MKSIIIIINLWVLLLTILSNAVEGTNPTEILDILNEMANRNDSIPGIFEPSKNGFLGGNLKSVVYKGILIPKPMEVSMKFTTDKNQSENDYRMYTYLNAVDKESAEAYGIPSIHYYGGWNDCFIMAMTLLDPHFHESFHIQNYNEVDVLILFREFVRVTKYIHSRGVFLHNIDFTQIIFRKQHGFIYDFIAATKHSSRTGLTLKLSSARVDWQQFLRAMYDYINYTSRWSWLEFSNSDFYRKRDIRSFATSLQMDAQLEESDETVKFTGLRKVFIEFTKYAYGDDATSSTRFYNRVHRVISNEIKTHAVDPRIPVFPSWVPNDQRNDETSHRVAPIVGIREPYKPDDIAYDKVDFELFSKRYHGQASSSAGIKRKFKNLSLNDD